MNEKALITSVKNKSLFFTHDRITHTQTHAYRKFGLKTVYESVERSKQLRTNEKYFRKK